MAATVCAPGNPVHRIFAAENSPAIYGWDLLPAFFPSPARDGRASSRPLQDASWVVTLDPAMNGWAIVTM